MAQKLIEHGFEIVEFGTIADIYIINTCTVTNIADRKSRQMARRAKQLNPKSIVVAIGCYAQVAQSELEKIDEIDLVLGNNEKKQIVKYLENYNIEKKQEIIDIFSQKEYLEYGDITYTEKTRAVVKIQDGCDRFCTYCIIPYARGRVRSRTVENILEEIKKNVENGIKEVVITGIHIASYGKDLENISLINLLESINQIPDLKRIRLGSLEPTIITDEFVTRLSKLEKICHHFHLSLQSGCNDTLKRMNRRYTVEEFKKVVERLKRTYPEVAITTDIIVGFPGETEEEFEQTKKFLKDIKFYKMHVFKYSPRKGTKAATMNEQISGEIKEKRSNELICISNKNEQEYIEQFIGKEMEVLLEEQEGDYIKGHTENYITVKIKANQGNENELRTVKLQKRDGMELIGVV